MDKRALLAIVLSFFVIYIYKDYFVPPVPAPQTDAGLKAEALKVKRGQEADKTASDSPVESAKAVNDQAQPVVVKAKAATVSKAPESFKYENNQAIIAISTLGGGGIESLTLKDYREELSDEASHVERINVSKGDPLPLSLSFSSSAAQIGTDKVFDMSREGENTLVYSWSSPQGITLEKRYTFKPDGYEIDIRTTLINGSSAPVTGDMALNFYDRDNVEGDMYTFIGLAVKKGDDIEKESFTDIEEEHFTVDADIDWLALENKYFVTALVPNKGSSGKVIAKRISDKLIETSLVHSSLSIPAGDKISFQYNLYSGPKDFYRLKDVGSGLEAAIDMGWFHAIAEPLLRFLKLIYSYTGNYGYAIILVTLIIKIIFFPLANKSYKSMKQMQKLSPLMTELREKYKDDKERMSREVMELYRKHRVNPLSGCLPMIVQIPVFIALYNVLMNAIELRHAPFHFWIMDMSVKDPYYVTPLLMGITMFLQQKMSPAAPDPTQQKVMMMMPVIFTFMFMNLPSGLVLYWLVNNILSIAQQYYIIKRT
ncbi:MAG: membrane protein insertase YidC [Deltaproteobacteria bacterium]|nr:membrane protein insertase YidC [Deltaproteobacteria bacterium]